MKQSSAFIVLILVISVVSLAQEPPKLQLEPDKPYIHQPTGFVVPASSGEFRRISGYRLDASGSHIVVGYNSPHVVATLYIVPKGDQTLEQQFDNSKKSVTKVHPKAKCLSEGTIEIKQDKQAHVFQRAVYELQMSSDDPRMVRSEIYLLEFGEFFLKYRISYPVTVADAADKEIAGLLSDLVIPARRNPEK